MVQDNSQRGQNLAAPTEGVNGAKIAKLTPSKTLTSSTCNPYIKTFKAMEYAARGPVILRAMEIETELRSGVKKTFSQVIKANLGDAHAMGQKPITFIRQVLALVSCPSLMTSSTFPADVKRKAASILAQCRGGSAGAYSDSRGLEVVRRNVSQYIERRDGGITSNPKDIVICAGASEGIRSVLKLFKGVEGHGRRSGVLVPVPEYPLYSATLGEYNIQNINYYLDESDGWSLGGKELDAALEEGRRVSEPRAIVVINPGNPTGAVLSRDNMESIIRFAYENRLFLLADEVYQDNVYSGEFTSFKKVLSQMPAPFNGVELVSFYSCSKGFVCECGLRGAYFEVTNMDPEVKSILLATAAAKLCPTVLGQAVVSCAVDPPADNDPSYPEYLREKEEILNGLGERARLVTEAFNSMPGISCAPVLGAMYAFPKLQLPPGVVTAAARVGQEPDVFYALELLEETGICVVPGSGIGQLPGTYHFRTTILPEKDQLLEMLDRFKAFHVNFLKRFSVIHTHSRAVSSHFA